jgi:hypothetical protein
MLVEPALELGLEPRAAVAELRELDEVLQLEVVDVVDQAGFGPGGAAPLLRGEVTGAG